MVQSDNSILLDVHDPASAEARRSLAGFAELEKSPEHIHTYQISKLSLWNARAAGLDEQYILGELRRFTRYPLPPSIEPFIRNTLARWGQVVLEACDEPSLLFLRVLDKTLLAEIGAHHALAKILVGNWEIKGPGWTVEGSGPDTAGPAPGHHVRAGFYLPLLERGRVKDLLMNIGCPVVDLAPMRDGDPLEVSLRETSSRTGEAFALRDYQSQAVEAFVGERLPGTGFGTIVLPCGSGKTVIGLGSLAALKTETLILTTNTTAVRQWIGEVLDKSDIDPELVGEYTGAHKEIKPITVATYQILVWRAQVGGDFPHFQLLTSRNWGLVIYDEVHLLPAPVFRITAELQAVRRLGLTATLVREDGLEKQVFSLVGPKRFDVPWRDLEARGWIARAICVEYRLDLAYNLKIPYAIAGTRDKVGMASMNPAKLNIVRHLLGHHAGESILVIGQYLAQLNLIAAELQLPVLTGRTPQAERERLFGEFRDGTLRVLVVSKVANFAVDLPDASVAIQVSGTFGSRQEEAQRLGRILRPKEKTAFFYTLVTRNSPEEEFSRNRQKFLVEQGYEYRLESWDE